MNEDKIKLIVRTEIQSALNRHKAKEHSPKSPRCPECGTPLLANTISQYKNRPAQLELNCPAPACYYTFGIVG